MTDIIVKSSVYPELDPLSSSPDHNLVNLLTGKAKDMMGWDEKKNL